MATDLTPSVLRSARYIPPNELAFDDGAMPSALKHVIDRTVASTSEAGAQSVAIHYQRECFIYKRFEVVTVIFAANLPIVETTALGK
jgi:hypothetical protein